MKITDPWGAAREILNAAIWTAFCGAIFGAGYLMCWLQVHGIE